MSGLSSTGITRKIDELGRIVIPKEIRYNLGIRDGEPLEIFVNDEKLLFHFDHKFLSEGKYSSGSKNKI